MYNFMVKLLNFIESSTDHTKSEIIIAQFILRNVEKIPHMTIYKLAEACHTSPATITRFCKKFDHINFKELKERARTFIEYNTNEVMRGYTESKYNANKLTDYFDELQLSLYETKKLLSSKEVMIATHKIRQAVKISFFGVTYSHLLARNAQFKFTRLGKDATAYSDPENQIIEAKTMTANDVAVVISFSGETRFIVRLVRELNKNNIPIIAITGFPNSFLAENADQTICISSHKMDNFKSPVIEEINLLSAVNSIYLAYSIIFK
ncbi:MULTISPECIES: MurR/RpiR family transcriptional regulator [Clostridia]|uniref:MurR/RpiR family transcriptional regulator n=1 Tax=Clostridia TaxID=186801 RepID=UPI000EA2D412|nr:MurR/RpiR family transcriptional regulator [Clostridium sp. 1xD42-85]NBJ69505.1 MurR/RpiR family transcriptional regulator [Roseburia sp. 1XD42-34]RKI78579.1 MurR/RpiR family transcriptional regulator [Clostridium sp. 1xD42-85]